MARYLITGGCGFIGSHLADALIAEGHQVRILDDLSSGKKENAPQGAEVVVGDINDAALVAQSMQDVDGCFHLAAIASVERSRLDWSGTHAANLSGTIRIFDQARQQPAPVPVVYASSAAVLGDNTDIPLTEQAIARPLTAYGADKLGCEQHAYVAWHVHRIPNIGFRFFNVYGPRQDPSSPYSGVISIFANRIGQGQDITIHGDGEQSRDFIYVGDIVRYLTAAMAGCTKGAAVYNACTGIATSVLQLAETLETISGNTVNKTHSEARTGDIRHSLGDPSAAIARFGIRATTTFEEGLRKTLAFDTQSTLQKAG